MNRLQLFLRILFIERRLPGKCYLAYYTFLHKLGFKIATIRVGRGVQLRGFTNSLTMAQETWSKRVYDHPDFTFCPGMEVVDIGANQGFFTTYAASFGANVYAFEPCVENFAHLKHNISANHFDLLAKAYQAAVSDRKGTIELFVGLDSKGGILSGSASIMNPNRGGSGIKRESVQTTTFEEILRDNRITQCDFLKLDCEGAEYEILAGLSLQVARRIRRVSIETHSGRGMEAIEKLRSLGFQIIEYEDGVTGFIKARRLDVPISSSQSSSQSAGAGSDCKGI